MTNHVELSPDSIEALVNEHGTTALEALHDEIGQNMPNTTFECDRLTIITDEYVIAFIVSFNRWSKWYDAARALVARVNEQDRKYRQELVELPIHFTPYWRR